MLAYTFILQNFTYFYVYLKICASVQFHEYGHRNAASVWGVGGEAPAPLFFYMKKKHIYIKYAECAEKNEKSIFQFLVFDVTDSVQICMNKSPIRVSIIEVMSV